MIIELRAPDLNALVDEALACGYTDRLEVVAELMVRGIATGFCRVDGEHGVTEYSVDEARVALEHHIEMRPWPWNGYHGPLLTRSLARTPEDKR